MDKKIEEFFERMASIDDSLKAIADYLVRPKHTEYGHIRSELKKNYAGLIVPDASKLPVGTHVTLIEKNLNGKEWFDHGEICIGDNPNEKAITTYDSIYDLNSTWEVYLDTRYDNKKLIKELGL